MITTTYHSYNFDTGNPEQARAYDALCDKLKAQGLRCFETWGGNPHYRPELDGRTLELETTHLFDNQWNTAPVEGVTNKGLRVFDWAQDAEFAVGNKYQKQGHYLDQTEEMTDIRRHTLKCGYCSNQTTDASLTFCPKCIGSEYLKASDLKLTRLRPVCDSGFPPASPELTEAEKAELLPKYREAQIHGNTERDKKRIAEARARVVAKCKKATYNATIERDGFLWFMDRGIRTENLIYYDHTQRFCFGWRTPLDWETTSAILDIISEFPFPYELKTADRGKLEGNIG